MIERMSLKTPITHIPITHKERALINERRRHDEIQQEDKSTSNDPLKIPSGPITRARSKSIKEALNGLVQEAWAKQMAIGSTIEDKDAENVTNVIWAEQGVV